MKAPLLIVSAVIIAFATLPVTAEDIHPRAQQLAERLSLDDEQTREISELVVEHRENMRERMESGERLREPREQLRDRIRAVLTPEQAETFDQLRLRARHSAERRGGDREAMQAREGSMRGERMSMPNLDADKREEIRALRERQREERQALRKRHRQEMQALMDDADANSEQEATEPGDG